MDNNNLENVPTPNNNKNKDIEITITDNDNQSLNDKALSQLQEQYVTNDIEIKEDNNNSIPNEQIQEKYEDIKPITQVGETNNQNNNDIQEPIQNDSQTIGTIQQEKQKNPIAIIILFVVLGVFLLFMPYIIDLTNKLLGTNIDSHNGENLEIKEKDKKDENEQTNSSGIQQISKELTINIDKIEYSNFEKTDNNNKTLKFIIKNTSNNSYKFNKKVYFDFYNDQKTFINRVYLVNLKEISGGVSNNYEVNIGDDIFNNATNIQVVLRTDDDYPNISLTNNQLACSNLEGTLIYTFNENKLVNIKDTYTYKKGSDLVKYNEDLLSYSSRINNLNNQDGVTAVLTETDNGFITNISIDYENADYTKLSSNSNYYIKDTESKVISFEMNAKGYICR